MFNRVKNRVFNIIVVTIFHVVLERFIGWEIIQTSKAEMSFLILQTIDILNQTVLMLFFSVINKK